MHPGEFNMAPGGLGKSFTPRFTVIDSMGDSTCYQGPKSKTNRYITRVLLRGPDKNFGKHSVVGYYYM